MSLEKVLCGNEVVEEVDDDEEEEELDEDKPLHNFTQNTEQENLIPKPRYQVTQTVYAQDIETTGILYHAIIRKCQYGPVSRKLNVPLHLATGGKVMDVVGNNYPETKNEVHEEQEDRTGESPPSSSSWHYFIHHFGWTVKWDRWVEECHIYQDDEKGQIFAQKVREAHASIVKKEAKDKIFLAVYKRSKVLEQEIYHGKDYSIESSEIKVPESDKTEQGKEKVEQGTEKPTTRKRDSKEQQSLEDWKAHEKYLRSMSLQGQHRYDASKDSVVTVDEEFFIPIPFPLKKILVDEWEVVNCGLYHTLPATLTVHDLLQGYFQSKVQMITGGADGGGENPTCDTSATVDTRHTKEYSDDELRSLLERYPSLMEWYDMVDGIKLLFDQALPCQLLYKSEVVQYLILRNNKAFSNKSHCEVYSTEFLLRLFLKFPLFVEDGLQRNAFNKDQLGPIIYRLGDLVRYLQRDPGKYFSLSYRRKLAEEITLEKKLSQEMHESEVDTSEFDTEDVHLSSAREEESGHISDIGLQKDIDTLMAMTTDSEILEKSRRSKRSRSEENE